MLRIINADGRIEFELIEKLKKRAEAIDTDVEKSVKEIIARVKEYKDDAVKEYNRLYDGVDDIKILTREDFFAAFKRVSPCFKDAITRAAKNIKAFHKRQIQKGFTIIKNGYELGQIIRGLNRVGIYVPGGRAPYPSTVLMNAIPASLAAVSEIVIFSPPSNGQNDNILAAAYVGGATSMVLAGGAHGIAAAAYGTQTIKPVDKIVGPGNIYVATAKRLVYGACDIDMVAGPSEIAIIADSTANPRYVAADLMSQAEHDPLASSILLTTDINLANNTINEINRQIEGLSRKEIIKKAFADTGLIIVCKSEAQMVELSNMLAPEHLEIMVKEPKKLLSDIKNAGSVFLGQYSPEPLGDYYAGTNHVLPTNGTARFYSPLSVDSFVKRIQYIDYSKEELKKAAMDINEIAGCEGFSAHANSINVRLK